MIGQRIKQLREERGISLSELAHQAGVAKSYLSAIERLIQINPSIQVIEKIAAVLEVPVQTLILSSEQNDDALQADPEWIALAKEAMESGISKEQFREFLQYQQWRSRHQDN